MDGTSNVSSFFVHDGRIISSGLNARSYFVQMIRKTLVAGCAKDVAEWLREHESLLSMVIGGVNWP